MTSTTRCASGVLRLRAARELTARDHIRGLVHDRETGRQREVEAPEA